MRLLTFVLVLISLIGCSVNKYVSPSDGVNVRFKSTTKNEPLQWLFVFENDYDCKGIQSVQDIGSEVLDLSFKFHPRQFYTIFYGASEMQGVYTFKVDGANEYSFTTDGTYVNALERKVQSNSNWKPLLSLTKRHLTRPGLQSGSWCKSDEAFKGVKDS